MKCKYIAIWALTAALLSGCSDQEIYSGGQEEVIRVFGNVAATRVSFETENSATHADWENGDLIGIFADGQSNFCYVASVQGTNTEFLPQASGQLRGADGLTVKAYYPYSETAKGTMVPLTNTSNYPLADMKPFVYASDAISNGQVSLRFKHLYAYLRLTIPAGMLPSWVVRNTVDLIRISVDADRKIGASGGTFDLDTGEPELRGESSEINISLDGVDVQQQALTCYIPVLPQEGAFGISFDVIQENDIQEVVLSCQKQTSEGGLKAGYVYNVSLNGEEEVIMSALEQKERMEAIGREFVSYLRVAEFNEMKNTARYIKNNFCEDDYRTEGVSTWWTNCLDAITHTASERRDTTTYVNENEYYSDMYWYFYHYQDLTRLYAASNFVGHFAVQDGKWTQQEGTFDDLLFTCTDQNGATCTASLTTSGATKRVYIGNQKDEDWYNRRHNYYEEEVIKYQYHEVINPETGQMEIVDSIPYLDHYKYYVRDSVDISVKDYENYVYLPERLTLLVTQGGKELLRTVVTTNLSCLASDEYDLSKHDFKVTAETYVNGYEFILSNASYVATQNAEVAFKMNKDARNFITLSAYSNGAVSGNTHDSLSVDRLSDMVGSIDILHQMQLKGSCLDGMKVHDYLEEADMNDTDEAIFKENVQKANEWMQLGLYFDGKSTQQAYVKLNATVDYTGWDGIQYWCVEPWIYFGDGTTYSTFEAFFNEEDFKELINMAWDVYDDAINLSNQFIRKF